MDTQKTAVLIHGHHLGAEGWEQVVWGTPETGVWGRIPRGLEEAFKWNATTILFGTGGSTKEGKLEGECMLARATERIATLPSFQSMGEEAARNWLSERAVLELTSINTETEIVAGAGIARSRGCTRLVLVSSPTHILRAHKNALSAFASTPDFKALLHELYAVASDTSYAGASVDDVVILEPPHRPDRPPVYLNNTLKPLMQLRKTEQAVALNEELGAVIKKYVS